MVKGRSTVEGKGRVKSKKVWRGGSEGMNG